MNRPITISCRAMLLSGVLVACSGGGSVNDMGQSAGGSALAGNSSGGTGPIAGGGYSGALPGAGTSGTAQGGIASSSSGDAGGSGSHSGGASAAGGSFGGAAATGGATATGGTTGAGSGGQAGTGNITGDAGAGGGSTFHVCAGAAPATAVTIYTIGDSTMSVYAGTLYPRMGWGQPLGDLFATQCATVKDKALSGRSSKSFFDEGIGRPYGTP